MPGHLSRVLPARNSPVAPGLQGGRFAAAPELRAPLLVARSELVDSLAAKSGERAAGPVVLTVVSRALKNLLDYLPVVRPYHVGVGPVV